MIKHFNPEKIFLQFRIWPDPSENLEQSVKKIKISQGIFCCLERLWNVIVWNVFCCKSRTNQHSLSNPSAKSCLVPCVPCPVELLLDVCRDQLTPDWGSADQPHRLCSKSHTAQRDGVVAVGHQRDMQCVNKNVWQRVCWTINRAVYKSAFLSYIFSQFFIILL